MGMLVLSRNEGEEIIMTDPEGRRSRIVVVESGIGGRVRLGFEAPREIVIHRAEIQAEIDAAAQRKEGA